MVPRLQPDPGNCDTRRTILDQRTHTVLSSDSDSDSDDANPDVNAGGEDDDDATNELTEAVPVEVDAWESDNEDDENMDLTNERPKRKRPEQKRMKDLNGKDLIKCGKKVALTEAERFRWSWNKRQELAKLTASLFFLFPFDFIG